jgi:hypothetical protein
METHIVKLTDRALLQRINRKLKEQDKQVRKCRENSRSYNDLGSYYAVDVSRNSIAWLNVDLTELARELDVLRPWESAEQGEGT